MDPSKPLPFSLPLDELARVIRGRRRAAGLSQAELARRMGVCEKTIKNVERGKHPPMKDTINRLLLVPELEMTAMDFLAPAAEEEPNSYLLPRYDRKRLLDEMAELFNSAGGELEQTKLYLDDASAAAYLSLVRTPRIQGYFAHIPHGDAAAELLRDFDAPGLDVIALGPGDGQNEARLCRALRDMDDAVDMRLYLLDISHLLLNVADQLARLALPGVKVRTLHGDFHHLAHYPVLLPRPETAGRRRLYTLLGCTLSNLNNEVSFWRDQLRLAAAGDFAVVDFQRVMGRTEEDSALQEPLPAAHVEWFAGPLLRHARKLADYKISTELNTACPVPGSYEIDCHAEAIRKDGTRQRYLLYRVRRYDPEGLTRCLEGFGWRRRLLKFYDPKESSGLLLLERV